MKRIIKGDAAKRILCSCEVWQQTQLDIIRILIVDWTIAEIFHKPGLELGVLKKFHCGVQSCDSLLCFITLVYNDGLD